VIPALTRLRDAGARLAVLTNGTLQSARTQLEFAGLSELFHQVLSADEVQRMKPAPEPYRMAAERFACQPEDLFMVAAHPWDLAGASAVGLGTAFLARPRQALSPSGPRPDFVASDLGALAELLLREPALHEAGKA
jgi:2-haloacid dehalogenase